MKVYVALEYYRKSEEASCAGVWKDKKKAVEELKATLDYDPDFSDPEDGEPYFGTTEWTVILREEELHE